MKISANLGFLFTDRPLPERILAAAELGFSAVELHWPYDTPARDVRAALDRTGLPVLALNTIRGDVAAGENGLSALAGREKEARAAIAQAFAYGRDIGAGSVHVMSGRKGDGADWDVLAGNLDYACALAADAGMGVLVEPLNPFDAPDYLLARLEDAADLLDRVANPALRVMFDIYHLARMGYDIVEAYRTHRAIVGHVQFASVPGCLSQVPPCDDPGYLNCPATGG